ncbi:MAG: NAD(P)/FAD-dependent oxidoreductase [Magnetococcus sp. YQC-9]
MNANPEWDLIVLGAGASGLMCAATAGGRGRRVLVLDHARHAGEKIRISGGGRCNFTHLEADPSRYLSNDPEFTRGALAAFTPHDFLALLARHGIGHKEKSPGQLFSDGSAEKIVAMLLDECRRSRVRLVLGEEIRGVEHDARGFKVRSAHAEWQAPKLVIALGGRSMPKLGASGLGYELARQFGLKIIPPRPGLTPLIFSGELRTTCRELAGISLLAEITLESTRIRDDLLFTHQGLSGPVILRISSLWRSGETLEIDLLPDVDLAERLIEAKKVESRLTPRTILSRWLPKRLVWQKTADMKADAPLAEIGDKRLRAMADTIHHWRVIPVGTGGYERAEVTVGGVDTNAIDPLTMACRTIPGLYFIGEVLDVTGWLGGYNLQWAWSSGHAAGLAV